MKNLFLLLLLALLTWLIYSTYYESYLNRRHPFYLEPPHFKRMFGLNPYCPYR